MKTLPPRAFNTIHINLQENSITKTSMEKQKILDEINWYTLCPLPIQQHTPSILNSITTRETAAYTMQFITHPPLANLFINTITAQPWEEILSNLMKLLAIFQNYTSPVTVQDYNLMFLDKTIERIEKLYKNTAWKEIINAKEIIINQKAYPSMQNTLEKITKLIPKIINYKHQCFIHGDYCLSNILYDLENHKPYVIDPRGSFGRNKFAGDIKYDYAKIRHCLHGHYDFILADQYALLQTGKNIFNLKVFTKDVHQEISQHYDLLLHQHGIPIEQVNLIEGLLFISMIPLHYDNPLRQKAMFLIATQILTESLKHYELY